MKKTIVLICSLLLAFQSFSQEAEEKEQEKAITSTYYLIRHAEKDRSDKENSDPELTKQGNNRAAYWASVFKNVAFDAVYSTNFKRTLQTAEPTADAKELEITLYDPFKLKMDRFLKNTKGKTVLIVGHSNTTPQLTNRLLNDEKFESMEDDDNGGLYIVTITGDVKTVQLLTIN